MTQTIVIGDKHLLTGESFYQTYMNIYTYISESSIFNLDKYNTVWNI